jgi:hypothetical protein
MDWLLLFVDAVETKQIIAPVLNTLVGDPKKVFEASHAQIHEALRALVKCTIKSGDIRKDLDPIDLLRALVGVANVAASPDWQQSAKRLVDILITGARTGAVREMKEDGELPGRVKVRSSQSLAVSRKAGCEIRRIIRARAAFCLFRPVTRLFVSRWIAWQRCSSTAFRFDLACFAGADGALSATIRRHYAKWTPEYQDRQDRAIRLIHGTDLAQADEQVSKC